MPIDWLTIAIAVLVLLAAAPYVAWIRHPDQRPFAAYLVFVTVFALASVVLFVVLGWLLAQLELTAVLGPWGLGAVLLLLGVVPALAVATWQARQPPMQRRPPE